VADPDRDAFYAHTDALKQLLRTASATIMVFERFTGMHVAQWRVLSYVAEFPGCTPGDLKTAHRVDPAAITRTVKMLERDGYLTRERDPGDARQIKIWLTDKGKATTEIISGKRQEYLRVMLAGINLDRISDLEDTLLNLDNNAITALKSAV